MSITRLKKDIDWGLAKEELIVKYYEEQGCEVERWDKMRVLDFYIKPPKGKGFYSEVKSRRCNHDTYEDTMIWLNKLIEAFARYNETWEETRFLFLFEDWLYQINPFNVLPRFDFKKWRWDRWNIDKEKWYIYYNQLEELWTKY